MQLPDDRQAGGFNPTSPEHCPIHSGGGKLPGFSKKARVAIKWSLDLLFPREIEQLVTLRDVEQVERIGAMLRAMRTAAATSADASADAGQVRETAVA